MDAAILHALIEQSNVQALAGDDVGQQDQVRRTAGGATGMPDLQNASSVRFGEIDDLAVRGSSTRKNGDLAALDKELNSSLPSHSPSER
jgi:hypothetical protein